MPANWLRDQAWLEDPQPPKAKSRGGPQKAKPKRSSGKQSASAEVIPLRPQSETPAQLMARRKREHDERLRLLPANGAAIHPTHGLVDLIVKSIPPACTTTFRVRGTGEIGQIDRWSFKRVHLENIVWERMAGTITEGEEAERLQGVKFLNNWNDDQLAAKVKIVRDRALVREQKSSSAAEPRRPVPDKDEDFG
jgi:hypothetical protein